MTTSHRSPGRARVVTLRGAITFLLLTLALIGIVIAQARS